MSTSVTLVDTDEVAHEVIASLRRRNRNANYMESSLNFSEFNNIVEKSQFAVQIGEHNSMKKLPNSINRDNVTEERLLAAIDTFVPAAASGDVHEADDSDEEGGGHLKTGWSSDEDDDRKSASPSKKGQPSRKGGGQEDDDDDLLLGGDDDDDFFRGFTAPVNSSKASKSTTGRGALRGIQDLSAGSGSHTRSLGGVGSAAGLGLNSAMMKPGQTIRVKAGGHVGKSANNGVPTHRK